MPDSITGTGQDGTTTPITLRADTLDRPDQERDELYDVRRTYYEVSVEVPPNPYEDPTVDDDFEMNFEPDPGMTYGIAFPKSMLPLGFMYGWWEADQLLDLEGEEQDVPYVRVWLHPPAEEQENEPEAAAGRLEGRA
jgi:hypothetical protein